MPAAGRVVDDTSALELRSGGAPCSRLAVVTTR
jgi:hypothetical protein